MDDAATDSWFGRLLQQLGLHRPELRAWAMYDWANSAMVATIVATVFPIYYLRVAAAQVTPSIATQSFAIATTISLLAVAFIAPWLGALADQAYLGRFL